MTAEPISRPIDDPLTAALDYAARGWRVVPIKPGGKHPDLSAWQNAATTDTDTINSWWTGLYKGHGVGIATGEESGIWVLDIDVAGDKCGDDTLHDIEQTYGALPDTVTSITGSGGRHLFFRWPDGIDLRNSAGSRLGPGIDVRGNGGQVVAAPTIHPNGRPYAWETAPDQMPVAETPGWLLALLEPPVPVILPERPEWDTYDGVSDSPAATFNASTTWAQLLTRDGWTLTATLTDGEQRWTRPGKEGRDGISATVGHAGRDVLKVFTSSVPGLNAEEAYSRFGYEAATQHRGDRSELARQIRGTMTPSSHDIDLSRMVAAATVTADGTHPLTPYLIDWPEFWHAEITPEWLLEPLFADGRSHAVYAGAKTGKSYLILAAAAALATGRPFLNHPGGEPVPVLYLDYEMTSDDVRDRLEEFGYGPDDDMSLLHYALLPSLPPLDTHAGGITLMASVLSLGARFVIVDTTSRSVEGEENDADTYRAFYSCTGLLLKQAGVGWARLDHSGKDATKGQRGSSAKNDDVDVVVRMERIEGGVLCKATHRRMSWFPEQTKIVVGQNYPVTFQLDEDRIVWPKGCSELAAKLTAAGIPINLSKRATRAAMVAAGIEGSNDLVIPAQKWRQAEVSKYDIMPVDKPRTTPTDHFGDDPTDHFDGPVRENALTRADHSTDHHGPLVGAGTDQWAVSRTAHGPAEPTDDDDPDYEYVDDYDEWDGE